MYHFDLEGILAFTIMSSTCCNIVVIAPVKLYENEDIIVIVYN